MASPSLTQSQLKELLHYDPDTGVFSHILSRHGVTINAKAGCLHQKGYVRISVKCIKYEAHRLAWLYMYGVWPKDQIDHINQIKSDNRITNLRESNSSLNQQNTNLRADNTSGYKGVSWRKGINKWVVCIYLNNTKIHLGYFDNLDDAIAARKQAEEQLHTHRSVA
jgi:hypothetical protein